MLNKLIKPITSDHDLIEMAELLGVELDAVEAFSVLKKPVDKKFTCIILLQGDGGGEGHWVAVCDGCYFDSYGVGPPPELGVEKYNKIQYQGSYSQYCGVYCVFWLYCKQRGKMKLLDGFYDLNDRTFE